MRSTLLLFLLSGFINAHVASQQSIKIWNQKNVTKKMKRVEMISFMAENNKKGLAVIICPGGSYYYLGMNHEGVKVAKWLQQNGITAFVLRYRTGLRKSKHPAMIQDLQRALQLVKENHATWQIDSCKVGVMGFSAGGHLAGTAATYYQTNFMKELGVEPHCSLRPDFVAMIYPVVSMTDSLAHKRSRHYLLGEHCSSELQHQLSLEQNVHDDMPPVFMIHCRKDKTVDYRNALYYSKALSMKDVSYDFTLYDESGHGFGINPVSHQASSWINNYMIWLRKINMIE